nr:hypothetical protein [Tanacetum cinerariifolium]
MDAMNRSIWELTSPFGQVALASLPDYQKHKYVDPYEEAALQAIEQVAPPLSPAYLPDPIELDEYVPVYVPEPEYLEYLKPPANDIPHADDAVPTTLSPGYIADLNPEEDLEEDPEEGENVDYANGHEEEDLEEEDSEEEDLKEEDPEEEEESDDNAASEEEPSKGSDDTEPSEEDETAVTPPPSRLRVARISIHPQTSMTPLFVARVAELLAMPTPPPSPLTLMSSLLPQILSPPLHDVVAALLMLPSTTYRSEVPKADMPPQKRLCFATPTTGFEVGESSAAVAARPPRDLYSFVDTTEAEVSITHRHAMTLHNTERKMMTAVELVNLRVSYEAQTGQRDGEGFHL